MPGVNTWNGSWSGKNKLYVLIRESKDDLTGYYNYDFGDGWRACVEVEEVDAKEARKLKRQSDGFCGYEWMVDSIIKNKKIEVPE